MYSKLNSSLRSSKLFLFKEFLDEHVEYEIKMLDQYIYCFWSPYNLKTIVQILYLCYIIKCSKFELTNVFFSWPLAYMRIAIDRKMAAAPQTVLYSSTSHKTQKQNKHEQLWATDLAKLFWGKDSWNSTWCHFNKAA